MTVLFFKQAVDELFKIMQLMVKRYPDTSEEEWKAISVFRRCTIQLYLRHVEPRHSWQSLIRSAVSLSCQVSCNVNHSTRSKKESKRVVKRHSSIDQVENV